MNSKKIENNIFEPPFHLLKTKEKNKSLFSLSPKSHLPTNSEAYRKHLKDIGENIPIKDGYDNQAVNLSELNSSGYRCDDFIKTHNDKHILFSGCSYTYGSGLIKNEMWSYILYKKILDSEKLSGFFNLGIPGSSIANQAIDIIKYCNTYGNPDYIFWNLPDPLRFYHYFQDEGIFVDAMFNDDVKYLLSLISYQYYFMVYSYCKSNNIKLLSFTWSVDNTPIQEDASMNYFKPMKNFETYYKYSANEFNYFAKTFNDETYDKTHWYQARDNFNGIGGHYGSVCQVFWSNFMYKKYMELLNV